jgi:hypothetical protein
MFLRTRSSLRQEETQGRCPSHSRMRRVLTCLTPLGRRLEDRKEFRSGIQFLMKALPEEVSLTTLLAPRNRRLTVMDIGT